MPLRASTIRFAWPDIAVYESCLGTETGRMIGGTPDESFGAPMTDGALPGLFDRCRRKQQRFSRDKARQSDLEVRCVHGAESSLFPSSSQNGLIGNAQHRRLETR